MNVYLFWILFLALWGIVPLMIIKGKTEDVKKVKITPDVKSKKKRWFKQLDNFNPSLEYKFVMNTEMRQAKYPEIFKNGGKINGSIKTIFREGLTFS